MYRSRDDNTIHSRRDSYAKRKRRIVFRIQRANICLIVFRGERGLSRGTCDLESIFEESFFYMRKIDFSNGFCNVRSRSRRSPVLDRPLISLLVATQNLESGFSISNCGDDFRTRHFVRFAARETTCSHRCIRLSDFSFHYTSHVFITDILALPDSRWSLFTRRRLTFHGALYAPRVSKLRRRLHS